jgi:hypothetical protein
MSCRGTVAAAITAGWVRHMVVDVRELQSGATIAV